MTDETAAPTPHPEDPAIPEKAVTLKILARQMRARYAALRSSVAAQTDKEGS